MSDLKTTVQSDIAKALAAGEAEARAAAAKTSNLDLYLTIFVIFAAGFVVGQVLALLGL